MSNKEAKGKKEHQKLFAENKDIKESLRLQRMDIDRTVEFIDWYFGLNWYQRLFLKSNLDFSKPLIKKRGRR